MPSESAEPLAMFFDDDFEPSNYVDALFSSVIKTPSSAGASSSLALSSQVYTEKNLHNLQNRCSNLVSHLDYYTNELFNQLSDKLETLKDTSSVVSTGNSYTGGDDTSITRLQYYIKSMSNAIASLEQEVAASALTSTAPPTAAATKRPSLSGSAAASSSASTTTLKSVPENAAAAAAAAAASNASISSAADTATAQNDTPVEKLSQLRDVKTKLQQVLDIFENIRSQLQSKESSTTEEYSTLSIDQFTAKMRDIQRDISSQIESLSHHGSTHPASPSARDDSTPAPQLSKKELTEYIDNLSSLLPLFQGTSFHTAYKDSISALLTEQERNLGRK